MIPNRATLAETIHKARWPAERAMAITPFADEDKNGRDYCFRIADAVISLLQPPALLWDANNNRHHEPVETLANEIYDAMPFINDRGEPLPGKKPKWIPHGNSHAQDNARFEARKRLRESGYGAAY